MPVAEAEVAPGHETGGAQRRRQIIGQRRVRDKRLEVQDRVAGPPGAQTLGQLDQRAAGVGAVDQRRVAQRVVVAEAGEAARAKERRVALAVAADQAGARRGGGPSASTPAMPSCSSSPSMRRGERLEPGAAEAEIRRARAREQLRVAGGQVVPAGIQPKPHAPGRLGCPSPS